MLRPIPSGRHAIGRAVAARRFSSSSSSSSNGTREEARSSSNRRGGGIGAAGALLAALAAADVAYPHYQQMEADRRAAAALLKGGGALAVSPSAAALAIAGGGGGHHGGVGNGAAASTPIPITIESASQHVKVVVLDKGTGHGNGRGNGNGVGSSGRLLPREALQRRVQGVLAPRAMGRGGYVVVMGPKGSGKSAVVREAALAQGAHVLYIDMADPAASADAEAAVRRALGVDGLPVHPPYQSLLGLAYGAAVRGLGGEAQGQVGKGEDEAVASVRQALRLLQRALVKAQQQQGQNVPPPTIVFDHLDALTPEAAAAVQDWAQGVTATEQPPLASTVALVAAEGTAALATLVGRPAWAGVAGQVEVPDLTEAEALAFLKQAAPGLRTGDARRLVALLGGRLVHLRRAVSGLNAQHQQQLQQQSGGNGVGKTRAGIEDVALEACEGMRAGYDRLMSLPPSAFLSPSTTTTASASSSSSSICCRHRVAGWSASASVSSQPPAMHALLAALLHSPTKTLPLPAAAAKLNLPTAATTTISTDAETGLAHRLLSEHGPVLALLAPARAGDPPRVGFASPLAEKFGYAYLSAYRHTRTAAAAGGLSAEQLVVAALAAETAGADEEEEEDGSGKKKRKGGGFPGLVSTALLAASTALYLAATAAGGANGNGDGNDGNGSGGGYRGIYLALPQPADIEALTRAAQQALRTSAAITADATRAVTGKLAAASHALGETLAAAAATAASHAANTPLKGRRDGGGGGSTQL